MRVIARNLVFILYLFQVPANSTVEPDNVLHLISEQTPAGFTTNYNEFVMDMNKDKSFRPAGDLISSYKQVSEVIIHETRLFHTFYGPFGALILLLSAETIAVYFLGDVIRQPIVQVRHAGLTFRVAQIF